MSDPVLELLNTKHIALSVSGRDYLIKCLNPDHEDTNPSLRVDKISGATHCFSCGFKTNIFRHFNVLTSVIPIRIAKLKEKIDTLKASSTGLSLPNNSSPYNVSFRDISLKTLRSFGAFYVVGDEKLQDRICFPIYDVTKKVRVFVARHTLSDAHPKYLYYPAGISLGVFPPSATTSSRSLVLVEGMFDMLNLYDKGLHNAACTFGTNVLNKSNAKEKLMTYKAQGISHIYIMYDGDLAGRKAAVDLKPVLEECEFVTEIIDLPDGTDPGNMSSEEVLKIIDIVKK